MEGSRKCCALISFALALAFTSAARADNISLAPRKDNTIYSESQYTNGGGQHFFVGTTQHNYYRRSLISFDVASNVPAGSTIQSVTVKLHMSMTNTLAHATNVGLHRCLAPWGEGSAVGLLGEGGGGPPGPGDATWTYNAFNTSAWATPGGDFASATSASTSVSSIDFYTWPSTPNLVADVQSMLDAPASNFGWVLVADSEGAGVISAKRFDSRENNGPEFRPVLEIVYSPMVATDGGVDAGLDAGRNDDAGAPDSGSPDGGSIDAGSPDAGSLDSGVADAGGDGGTNSRISTAMEELGAGCQAAPGSLLAILGLALLAVRRSKVWSRARGSSDTRPPKGI